MVSFSVGGFLCGAPALPFIFGGGAGAYLSSVLLGDRVFRVKLSRLASLSPGWVRGVWVSTVAVSRGFGAVWLPAVSASSISLHALLRSSLLSHSFSAFSRSRSLFFLASSARLGRGFSSRTIWTLCTFSQVDVVESAEVARFLLAGVGVSVLVGGVGWSMSKGEYVVRRSSGVRGS